MARPQKTIDQASFEKLCGLFCTMEDIASFFEGSVDTIERWCQRTYKVGFAEAYKKYSAKGRTSIRRWQFQAAEKGSTAMLIFLGKNYLGQKDTTDIEYNPESLARARELLGGVDSVID